MKLIIAVIQPHRLEEVRNALNRHEVYRLTVSDAQGYGQQKGYREVFRGREVFIQLVKKLRLEIAVPDELAENAIEALIESARTAGGGKIGDGKIFVIPMEECIRIRTGERGEEAI
ncbi:MAG TPA: transcriptional regulator [Leptospiraceae bacterium]|nr:transcriptional regulator [Spirochaetaceae bacterium]HBS03688.1 transcriptional regulator [Leptospiraceae bacterium]|tara:strand:+ start:21527 stop:21874 length:348 start_codon:yes stop_codon:yes gene_type:complete